MHASAVLAQNRASFQTVALFGTPTSSISATRDAHSTFQSQFDGRYYVARRVDWQCRTCAKFCLYVKKLADVDQNVLEALVVKSVAAMGVHPKP